ncbi:MAG: molybdopterin synthase sulfur carrier [Planctomycetota bacterium]|nr:MAG: molybdopterin synthase sulfur carrier [Planctomycetota bacterium]
MKVRVLFFASVADAAGTRSLDAELGNRATVADLRRKLEKDRPRLAGRLGKCAAAVNTVVVSPARALADGDEVAFLPPVSGGAE